MNAIQEVVPARRPRRVVALGGGTGLPAVLRGLRDVLADGGEASLTAVVAMSDDGGSSGRLRRSRGLPPPGDVRNCLVALSAEEDLLAGLFQHRYEGGDGDVEGHSLGNLILAALAERTGSFLRAVEVSSRVLRTVGRILPVTLEDVTLVATLEDGSRRIGESAIGASAGRIQRVWLRPETARPTPGVVEAIEEADLIVLGPGSLFTSVIPSLALGEVAGAMRRSRALRVLVANLVTTQREAPGLSLEGHLEAIEIHAGGRVVDVVLVHEGGAIAGDVIARYEAEGAAPLVARADAVRGARVLYHDMLAAGPLLRHDPRLTAGALLEAWRRASARSIAEGRT